MLQPRHHANIHQRYGYQKSYCQPHCIRTGQYPLYLPKRSSMYLPQGDFPLTQTDCITYQAEQTGKCQQQADCRIQRQYICQHHDIPVGFFQYSPYILIHKCPVRINFLPLPFQMLQNFRFSYLPLPSSKVSGYRQTIHRSGG